MVVYLDLVFLVNFILDLFLIWMTGIVLRQRLRLWRGIVSAIIGTAYTFVIFFPQMHVFMSISAKFLLSVVMIVCAFGWYGPLECLKRLLSFYLVSCMLGGAAYAIAFLVGTQETAKAGLVFLSGSHVLTANIIMVALIIAPVFVWLCWKKVWVYMQQIRRQEGELWSVQISVCGKEMTCTGLLDTGNGLLDPISKQPVTVVTLSALKPILPEELVKRLESDSSKIVHAITEIDWNEDWMSRFRIIPFRAIGVSSGMMVAFQPDRVKLWRENQQERVITRGLIGISTQMMSKTETFSAIVHPLLLA
ncbi:sigma-E processing peptidase SpoIIGA [Fodinisporobacter ferrooxydans]|uniref:Sporulation sigma-E factor-processing peptidase n=1 Tax=Fodinisporobacter ferrooxydans TaxID=2901836 RepID=A0ABY4CGM6_9BACL|nr:sigma-E processing peptidase SpoIIGA [Alicyclobacillaceae bacterium MYW30-H2]